MTNKAVDLHNMMEGSVFQDEELNIQTFIFQFLDLVVMVIMMMVALLARMGMDDEEAVALIGGGHGVGKAHGACPLGAGPAPSEDPFNPWPGRCGAGKLEEAFTSGLELPWTTRPTSWDNEFFSNLLDYEWELHQVTSPRLQCHMA